MLDYFNNDKTNGPVLNLSLFVWIMLHIPVKTMNYEPTFRKLYPIIYNVEHSICIAYISNPAYLLNVTYPIAASCR